VLKESLSQIIDNERHPLHTRYVEALASVRQPCSHGKAILNNNPHEVFTDEVLSIMAAQYSAYLIPTFDRPCEDFIREYKLYAFLGAGGKLNLSSPLGFNGLFLVSLRRRFRRNDYPKG
jgi:hypothetical protein